MSKRRPKGLTDDDLQVWQAAAQTMRPMKSEPLRSSVPKDIVAPPVVAPSQPNLDLERLRLGGTAAKAAPSHDIQSSIGARLASMPLSMDAKTHKRMTKGKLKPEAKLDLHGKTLAQAHPALIGFIQRAFGDGLRLVLVVTGKGKDRDSGGPIPTPRGLLKHHVPGWLQAPGIRPMILQVTDAHIRHGGGGAYYVYLRRRG